jgi:hypothetical protein
MIDFHLFNKNIDYLKPLSEEFIRKNKNKVYWSYISYYQKLSEEFIKEFQDKVDWFYISKYQKLSEDFIREFKDKVNWKEISLHKKLSENFIREFQDKINWEYLLKKFGYELLFNNKYLIKSDNYYSDLLDFSELIELTLRLIALKAFK